METKFRVWDTAHKRHLYPDTKQPKTGHVIDSRTGQPAYQHDVCHTQMIGVQMTLAAELYQACYYDTASKAPHLILEQFIGMQDKNGKDIYVGDILKGFASAFIIEFGIARRQMGSGFEVDIPCFYFLKPYTQEKLFPINENNSSRTVSDLQYLEVAGDIHQHRVTNKGDIRELSV